MATPGKLPRLLVIEDNPDTRGIYKDVFEREHFEVFLAEDGQKGLSYAEAMIPDIILLDLMLPKISGFDILKRLRAQDETRNIPVMVFSARDAGVDLKLFENLGMTEYSAKALNTPKQMVHRIRALMARAGQPESPDRIEGSLRAALKDTGFDASQLLQTLGLTIGFCCPQCKGVVIAEMLPDPTRTEGHWFATRFVCSDCRRSF